MGERIAALLIKPVAFTTGSQISFFVGDDFKQALEARMKGKKFVCSVRKIMYGCAILLFVREDLAD